MIGSIIGDLAGSIYEYNQIDFVSPVKMKNVIEDNAFYSDDTILTVAVMDAASNCKNFEQTIKEYALANEKYKPKFSPYFATPFSPGFLAWVHGKKAGTSNGNGALMRVCPVGYYYKNAKEVKKQAILATKCSHNSQEAIKDAVTVAMIVYYAKKGLTKDQIISKLKLEIKKPKLKAFNMTCENTLDLCLYSLFTSDSFEDAIRLALSFGGDTDTNAAIVGGMAEALYGVPQEYIDKAMKKLPSNFKKIIEEFYAK